MTSEQNNRPLFIVGPSRSGTTLTRAVINGCGTVHVTTETHYFEDLRDRLPGEGQAVLSGQERDMCEDYFLALGHRPYGHEGDPENSRWSRPQLRNRAVSLGGTGDAYFEAFCRINAEDIGATEWGEKTPRHVYRIADILETFPEARILCVIRDPRAVVASYKVWRYRGGFQFDGDPGHKAAMLADYERARRSYNLLIISMMWASASKAMRVARDRHGPERVRVLAYEELVTDPDGATRALAEWLDTEWSPRMMDVPFTNSSTEDHQETGGIRSDPSRKWERILSRSETGVVQAVCSKEMAAWGYSRLPDANPFPRLVSEAIAVPLAVLRGASANRSRMVRIFPYVMRRLPFRLPKRSRSRVRTAMSERRS